MTKQGNFIWGLILVVFGILLALSNALANPIFDLIGAGVVIVGLQQMGVDILKVVKI